MQSTHNHNTDVCPVELAGALGSSWRRLFHKPEKILAGMVQPGQTAADFGCGPGYFTLELARQVGDIGKVYAVDLQQGMLDIVRAKAEKAGLVDRIIFHKTGQNEIGLQAQLDFGMTFWMVHEVPDRKAFLSEIAALLNPGGRLLVVEPRLHVSGEDFERSVSIARECGLQPIRQVHIAISRGVLLEKE